MNILIVDDERDQLESLRRGLRSQRHKTVEAINAAEALAALKTEPALDLVLTDYAMPGMDGLMLLEKIRREHHDLPVIMMTAFGDKNLVVRAMQNHCNGYIEKPFTLLQLLREIQKVTSYVSHRRLFYSDTISRMTHQINNPLMAIIGSAELGLHYGLSEDNREKLRGRLNNIIGAAKQIQQINQQIMGLGRVMVEKPAPVDLRKILDHCLEMYRDLLKEKKMIVSLETDGNEYVATGSSYALEQVFKNLLLNAMEAVEESALKQINIALRRNQMNRDIEISIEDTGIGIEPAKLSKVFTPYYTSKPHGNGIGLAIAKSVVEQFKGRIQVKSWLGEGTHFLVTLPALN